MTPIQCNIEPISKVQCIHDSINWVMQGVNQARTFITWAQLNICEID